MVEIGICAGSRLRARQEREGAGEAALIDRYCGLDGTANGENRGCPQ